MDMFGKLTFDGSVAYATTDRIRKDNQIPGFYYYGIRLELSDDNVVVYTIEPFVFVNFIGTFITETELEFDDPEDKHRILTRDEYEDIEFALYDEQNYTWDELMYIREVDMEDTL